jgi:hypothetical protein
VSTLMDAPIGVVVLGMHRSGTSAVAGMFVRAGYFAGSADDLIPPGDHNLAGYFEHVRIRDANERILRRLGGTWLDPPPSAAQLGARSWGVHALQTELDRLIDAATGKPIVIKDPRICVMMPLWDELISGRLHPVVVIRDPIEIARSLTKRNGIPALFALASWELHMVGLLECLHGREVTVASYGALVTDGRLCSSLVSTVAAHLAPTHARQVSPSAAFDAVQPELRHHRAALRDHDELLTLGQRQLWEVLSSLRCGDERLDATCVSRTTITHARTVAHLETERIRASGERAPLGRYLTTASSIRRRLISPVSRRRDAWRSRRARQAS